MSADLQGKRDIFDGMTVASSRQNAEILAVERFSQVLPRAIEEWKADGVRGVWFQIDLAHSQWVPVLAANGFDFHHAQPDYLMMTKWLPADQPNSLPKYPFTSIGVGGLVVNKAGQVLLMKERRGIYKGWKYPGGLGDPGEQLFETAEREVFEETGVRCKAKSVLCFRHQHQFKWRGNSDIYVICLMAPIDENDIEPKPCPQEAEASEWMSREQINQLPSHEFHEFHQIILQKYDEYVKKGTKGCYPVPFEMPQLKRTWTMYFVD